MKRLNNSCNQEIYSSYLFFQFERVVLGSDASKMSSMKPRNNRYKPFWYLIISIITILRALSPKFWSV